MNTVNLIGRLCKDPETREVGKGDKATVMAVFTLAVDRIGSEDADFIRCVMFGKTAEFAEQYLKKGIRIGVTGRIQTGSYTNKDGVRVYTTDVVVEDQEFAESKNASGQNEGGFGNSYSAPARQTNNSFSDGFMNIPDGIDEELPFN